MRRLQSTVNAAASQSGGHHPILYQSTIKAKPPDTLNDPLRLGSRINSLLVRGTGAPDPPLARTIILHTIMYGRIPHTHTHARTLSATTQ